MFSGRTFLSAFSSDRSHPVASLCVPYRRTRNMFGFRFDCFSSHDSEVLRKKQKRGLYKLKNEEAPDSMYDALTFQSWVRAFRTAVISSREEPERARAFVFSVESVESKTHTYRGRIGSGRSAGRPGGIGQNRGTTTLLAQETMDFRTLQSIEDTSSERPSRSTNKRNPMYTDLSSPKPGHTTGRSGRGARRSGEAGSSTIECQHNCSPREQASLVPFKA